MVSCSRYSGTVRLDGKTAIVTGSNTGIGKFTALDFVKRGARVIMACRSVEKAEAAAEQIRGATRDLKGAGAVDVVKLDLGSLTSVRQCADQLLRAEQRVHLLVNNAGVMACPQGKTEDGFETHFGVNHLGHFLFTCLLLPRVIRSAPARIVTVSSKLHENGNMNFDDLNLENSYGPVKAYNQSKLANVLFSNELARRLEGTGVTTYSVHPGVVRTELGRHLNDTYFRGLRSILGGMGALFFKTAEDGAQTTIYCSLDEKLTNKTGLYYSECREKAASRRARDPEAAKKLWDLSAKMAGLGNWDPFTADDGETPS
ncbi:retinol dehydrogenase 12-like isoform X1 [Zootermopsis nevadensis]|uniref:Retinol dehydrogenase 12 n=1 Tax=Zootermopsis nevadensis TaxID=136037 RepID=A0A067QZN5_ZOONE|nr:retinol dehydrogenase 12-like isoform X1 [Zootermopsis nevadensis]XP_021933880.1 retinol dehydrogenase 12-like isoform X1 [Zootermopsis nevadensis]XP_021933881.1 retinol dehydrogenase 12-like isoform X1 [Zootermopsis nevadensis]XP_021933882.1 retinol dehydrogenase 12-like isoform X1 [Zootermopsis nevadensis]XP_021933883.1 retinol dehydrogenase 12-like isoform X1 [Zootermopsis nevadensis]KDR11852.1 Retinol dehydrogenase 12 [Zootermopsis nevadensis]